MEEKISQAIIGSYFEKLRDHLALAVAAAGAGPGSRAPARAPILEELSA